MADKEFSQGSNPWFAQQYWLSRRAFLRTVALAGGATALSAMLPGCAAPTTTGGAESGAAPAAEAGPSVGGVYRLTGGGDIRSLDPPAAESSEDWWSAGMVLYNQLYFYDKDGNFYADLAADMLRRSLDAFARLDVNAAASIIQDDAGIDERFRAILRQLITFMMEDPRTIGASIDMVWVAKAIERIGDHSKNIAEHVIFIAAGADVRHSSPEEVARIVSGS